MYILFGGCHLEYCKNSNARPVCYVVEIPPSGIGVGESQQLTKRRKDTQRFTTRGNYNDIAHSSFYGIIVETIHA